MSRLETVTNGAVIFAALLVAGVSYHNRLQPTPSAKVGLLSAQLIGKPLNFPGDRSPIQSVALFVSSTCRFCTSSMVFYQRLAELHKEASCGFRLVAMGPSGRETKDEIRDYLARNELTVDDTNVVDFVALGIPATPTLLISDANNLVKHAWVGLLSQEAQDEVVSKIKVSCRV